MKTFRYFVKQVGWRWEVWMRYSDYSSDPANGATEWKAIWGVRFWRKLNAMRLVGDLQSSHYTSLDMGDHCGFLRGVKAGLYQATLETKYGSFSGHVQAVLKAAREVTDYEFYLTHSGRIKKLAAALKAHDEFIAEQYDMTNEDDR